MGCYDSGHELWDKIPGDTEIFESDTVRFCCVLLGSPGIDLRPASIHWRHKEEYDHVFEMQTNAITLNEIVEQIRGQHNSDCIDVIYVVVNDMFWSEVWQYGNYGDYWIVSMKGIGYA